MLLFIEESMNAGRDAFLSSVQFVKIGKIASGILAAMSFEGPQSLEFTIFVPDARQV
jgi:hypothetical protein